MRMQSTVGTGSIPTGMPACCFARGIEAKPGVFAAVPGFRYEQPPHLEKKARQCGGQRFREEAL
jgi:hypothetical protein